jgi:hypothetical protein
MDTTISDKETAFNRLKLDDDGLPIILEDFSEHADEFELVAQIRELAGHDGRSQIKNVLYTFQCRQLSLKNADPAVLTWTT